MRTTTTISHYVKKVALITFISLLALFSLTSLVNASAQSTNYLSNDNFNYNITGWVAAGAHQPVVAWTADNYKYGPGGASASFTGTTSGLCQNLISIKSTLNNKKLYLSAWVKTNDSTAVLSMSADKATAVYQSSTIPGDGQWHYISTSFTPILDYSGTTS
jgi:hypothetical protein